MFERNVPSKGSIKPVRVMCPGVIDIGFPVIQSDGTIGSTGTIVHKNELLKTIQRFDFPISAFVYSSADTASHNIGAFYDPITNHEHWTWNSHRMDLAFKDLFNKFVEAQQIVDPFIKISAYLTGKGHQRVDTLRVSCEKAGINFKRPRSICNTRFVTYILVVSRILDLMPAIEQLKTIGENGFDRSMFAKSGANDDAVTYSALKNRFIE